MNRHGSMDAMHDEEETKKLTEYVEDGDPNAAKEESEKNKEKEQHKTSSKSIDKQNEKKKNKKKDISQENNNENNNKSKRDKTDKKAKKSNFKTKYFPWIVCATSFIVQFFVLGFYKAFGPVYVKLLQAEPEGYGGTPVATCK